MPTPTHDLAAILRAILPGYTLPRDGTHGLRHWARVLENALRLCAATSADTDVVTLFAVFHDARQVNEHRDDGHGHRGAELAASLRGSLVHLDDGRFELLYEACRLHADGGTTGDLAMQVCWDSDRLDLGRVAASGPGPTSCARSPPTGSSIGLITVPNGSMCPRACWQHGA